MTNISRESYNELQRRDVFAGTDKCRSRGTYTVKGYSEFRK